MTRLKSASEAVVQELGPAVPQRGRIGWSEQRRASNVEVQRYSRFVVVMKRALPIAAFALLAVVVAYSLVPRQPDQAKVTLTFRQLGIINNDLAMIDPKLTGIDSDGNPYVVTAEKAVQYAHEGGRALLKNVEADLTLKDGDWLNATAPNGVLYTLHSHDSHGAKAKSDANQILDLSGPISVFSDNGYEVHTTVAHIDMGAGIVRGPRYVRGQGPLGTFNADKFVFTFHGRQQARANGKARQAKESAASYEKIFLYGNVHMTIFATGSRKS